MSKYGKGYWSADDLGQRFRCSSRSIFRWMKRGETPFPPPRIKKLGSHNLWAIEDVLEWERQIQSS